MGALEGCESLRVLELGYNVFGAEGMQHLSDALKDNLQVLIRSSCCSVTYNTTVALLLH
jgi:hypothetical protein